MPVDKGGEALRAALRKKTRSELESLLAAAFSEKYDTAQGDELAMAVMEVMCEREEDEPAMSQAELDASWEDFQRRLAAAEAKEAEKAATPEEKKEAETTADAGAAQDPKPMHTSPVKASRNTSHKPNLLYRCAIAAVLAVVVCFISFPPALGFNVFQAIADWTAEQFGFAGVEKGNTGAEDDPLWNLRITAEDRCNVPSVPTWAPEGTEARENVSVAEGPDRVTMRCGYETKDGEFTIHLIIYDVTPENYTGTYQKDNDEIEPHEVNGVTHYLMDNNGRRSVVWTNGRLEGHIQGDLSMTDLKKMVDSIYAE